MSIRLMSSVWDLDLPDSEKLVLLALADWSNDSGECWPSVPQLAKKCSKSERTVQGVIQALEKAGHLSRDMRAGKGCVYHIHPRSDCTPAAAAPRKPRTPAKAAPAQRTTPTPAAAAPNTLVNTTISTETTSPPRAHATKPAGFPCPAGVEAGHWSDLLENRKAKRLRNTPTAHAGILRELARLSDDEWPPGRLVQHAAEKGWGAIYDPRNERNGHDRTERGAVGALRGSRPDPALDMWRSAQAELAAERAGQDEEPDRGAWLALPASFSG